MVVTRHPSCSTAVIICCSIQNSRYARDLRHAENTKSATDTEVNNAEISGPRPHRQPITSERTHTPDILKMSMTHTVGS